MGHRGRLGERGVGNSASDGHAVESLYVPCVRLGVVAVHHGGFFNETPSLAARHVDHHRDAVHHAPTGHVPRQLAPAWHGSVRAALNYAHRTAQRLEHSLACNANYTGMGEAVPPTWIDHVEWLPKGA